MKTVITTKIFFILFFFLWALPGTAQIDDPDENEDGENEPLDPPAPIDDHLIPLLILGVVTGFYLIKSKSKINSPDKG